MKADYELRHKLYGQQGSLWERQVDAETRSRIRTIVTESGHSSLLAKLDAVAASAINTDKVLMEDLFFRFVDGDFAVIGKRQREYSHRLATMPDGTRLYVGYRTGAGSYSADPLPTKLARVSEDFLSQIQEDQSSFLIDQSRDWYLVPIPSSLIPIVIQGKDAGDYLVQGVDFLAFDGYIALIDPPTSVLPLGPVKVNSAYRRLVSPNTFVLSAPAQRTRNKWLANYAYQSQSLEACRKAAAEYAGLYVFQEADVVLAVHDLGGDARVYSMAAAGAIEVNYPHTPLLVNQSVAPGHIVCLRFDLVSSRYGSSEDSKKIAYSGWAEPIVLDGILPVNGLTWNGNLVTLEAGDLHPVSGKPHIRMMFDGDPAVLDRFWNFSALHERATGVMLYDELGQPSLPMSVDFWELLQTFYGSQLALAISADHGPVINSRLWRFLFEYHPKSCNILLSMDLGAALPPAIGGNGEPLVDENGEYVGAPLVEECVDNLLTVFGNALAINNNPLSYTICDLP